MKRLHKPFPVPEAPPKTRVLEAGTLKHVFIDRNAGAEGLPAWLVYVPEQNLVYRMREGSTKHMEGLNVRFRGHKTAPLKPDGPAFWVETTAAIEVQYDETN